MSADPSDMTANVVRQFDGDSCELSARDFGDGSEVRGGAGAPAAGPRRTGKFGLIALAISGLPRRRTVSPPSGCVRWAALRGAGHRPRNPSTKSPIFIDPHPT